MIDLYEFIYGNFPLEIIQGIGPLGFIQCIEIHQLTGLQDEMDKASPQGFIDCTGSLNQGSGPHNWTQGTDQPEFIQ